MSYGGQAPLAEKLAARDELLALVVQGDPGQVARLGGAGMLGRDVGQANLQPDTVVTIGSDEFRELVECRHLDRRECPRQWCQSFDPAGIDPDR